MSYDLQLFVPIAGKTPILKNAAKLSAKQRKDLVESLCAFEPKLEVNQDADTKELIDPENGVIISISGSATSLSVPYTNREDRVNFVLNLIHEYLKVFGKADQFYAYDPQLSKTFKLPASKVIQQEMLTDCREVAETLNGSKGEAADLEVDSEEEAERIFFDSRDRLLDVLQKVAKQQNDFQPDLTPESLKDLEKWYFDLRKKSAFHTLTYDDDQMDIRTFQACMDSYFGSVAVHNIKNAKWVINNTFGSFVLAVNIGFGTYHIVGKCTNLHNFKPNKHKDYLYREFELMNRVG